MENNVKIDKEMAINILKSYVHDLNYDVNLSDNPVDIRKVEIRISQISSMAGYIKWSKF